MKILRILTVFLFLTVIVLPLVFFNTTPDAVSLIDNRKLAESPFTGEDDLTINIENYVNDRIGFRDSFISAYTLLNDRLFGVMVHPSYSYGKDGYVFGAGVSTANNFGQFHMTFLDMVEAVQAYCDSRGVPFLFVFEPAKPAVYQDKIADGIRYNREWVDRFMAELESRGIRYLDNTETLTALAQSGIHGFNRKYDANHWNDTGAFYGTREMLRLLQAQEPSVHVNELEEFTCSTVHRDTLQVSDFPIDEDVPAYALTVRVTNRNEEFEGVKRHPSYPSFGYYVNGTRADEGAPRALVFQGSYMNSYGSKYLMNAFSEYIHVHDYQNVINFPYYFNIFQPECVIFEVAEYTLAERYFNLEQMENIRYNPSLTQLEKGEYAYVDLSGQEVITQQQGALTVITWKTEERPSWVWLQLDAVYDMQAVEGGYEVTIASERYTSEKDIRICVSVSPETP